MRIVESNRRRVAQFKDVFPFELDGNASFLIINETTLEERVFSYSEVIDGTYDTWLAGAEGGILEWRYFDLTLSSGYTSYVRLKSNSGNPFLNDWDQSANLGQTRQIDMANDWVVTLILDKELNGNNQRLNLGVRGSVSNLFALQLSSNGEGYVVIDRLTGSTGVPDYQFLYPYTNDFKLFTFSKISGVFNIEINDVDVSLTANTGSSTVTSSLNENTLVLGSRSYPDIGSGKITNYKHFKVKTGDLSSFDVSAYNQAIMTKYGIV